MANRFISPQTRPGTEAVKQGPSGRLPEALSTQQHRDASQEGEYTVLFSPQATPCCPQIKEDPESKTQDVPRLGKPRMSLTHRIVGTKKAGQDEVWLSYFDKVSAAANTAFAFNFPLQPNLDSEWASWQELYSEVKVLEVQILWNVWFLAIPTVLSAQSPNAALYYDAGFSGKYPTAVNDVLSVEHFSLLNFGANANGTFATSPQAVASGGHVSFRHVLPQGGVQSSVSTLLSTGLWRPTADASNYNWGQIVGYCASAGTTSQPQVEAFVRMRVHFRNRI